MNTTTKHIPDANHASADRKLTRHDLAAVTGGAQYVRLTAKQREALQGTTVTDPVSDTFNKVWKKVSR